MTTPGGRITEPLLDVLELLVAAWREGTRPHGWLIIKATKRSGPTVYGVLDRLEEAEWITGRWAEVTDGKPRRREYQLTSKGFSSASDILAARRTEGTRTRKAGAISAVMPQLGPVNP